MPRANRSGIALSAKDASLVRGMVKRGDRAHDIAAWFGVNQGRIAEVSDGTKHAGVAAAPLEKLPPKGPPGVKGQRLYSDVRKAIAMLEKEDTDVSKAALAVLLDAQKDYDANER